VKKLEKLIGQFIINYKDLVVSIAQIIKNVHHNFLCITKIQKVKFSESTVLI